MFKTLIRHTATFLKAFTKGKRSTIPKETLTMIMRLRLLKMTISKNQRQLVTARHSFLAISAKLPSIQPIRYCNIKRNCTVPRKVRRFQKAGPSQRKSSIAISVIFQPPRKMVCHCIRGNITI